MTEPLNTTEQSQRYAEQLIELANTERRKQNERRPVRFAGTRRRAVLAGLAVAIPTLVVILLTNFGGAFLESFFEVAPPAAVAREEAQKTLDALVSEIEAFRKDYNELPQTLVEIGVPPGGTWKYAAVGRQYRVQGSMYGQRVSFDSATRAGDR